MGEYSDRADEPDVRVLESDADLATAAALFRTSMVGLPPAPPLPEGRIADGFEPGMVYGAFVDGAMVGTANATSGTLTLPGGSAVPHIAVTHVGVSPTHTRRGVLTAVMRRQVRDAHARGVAVATLRASEATIYSRFGYGVASSSATLEVDVRRATLHPGAPAGGPVRLLSFPDAWDTLVRIHERTAAPRPGGISRSSYWWGSQARRAAVATGPLYVAVHGEPGRETGFVRYHPVDTDTWFTSDRRTVVVTDFFAQDADTHAGLLRFLLGLDLVDRIRFGAMPVDDPLPLMLTDRRAARVTAVSDETWLRIVDVERVLGERCFRGADALTVEVRDAVLPINCGTFEISADGARRTDAAPSLVVDVAGLGSVLLGGTSWHALVAAGRVRADHVDVVVAADVLFGRPVAPFAGTFF